MFEDMDSEDIERMNNLQAGCDLTGVEEGWLISTLVLIDGRHKASYVVVSEFHHAGQWITCLKDHSEKLEWFSVMYISLQDGIVSDWLGDEVGPIPCLPPDIQTEHDKFIISTLLENLGD